MQFNVASLLQETTGAVREYEIDDDVRIDGVPQRLRGHARVDRTQDGVLVRASLAGETEDQCSRCLLPLRFPVELTIEEEYLPTVDIVSGAVVEPPEGEDDAYRIDRNHMLDLTEPVQHYWAMSLPMAPLCRDDCAGICPICGQDRRADGHVCTGDQVDARWEKLQNLQLG